MAENKKKKFSETPFRSLIYPNGVTEEYAGWLSIFFENINDVRLELDVEIRCMGQAAKELIPIQKRSSQGIRKGLIQKNK